MHAYAVHEIIKGNGAGLIGILNMLTSIHFALELLDNTLNFNQSHLHTPVTFIRLSVY